MRAVAARAVGDLDRRRRAPPGRGSCRRRSASGRRGRFHFSVEPRASRGRACRRAPRRWPRRRGSAGPSETGCCARRGSRCRPGASLFPLRSGGAVDARRQTHASSAAWHLAQTCCTCILLTNDEAVEPLALVVRAVAVDAGRRPGVAPQERLAVDAVLVGGDEARRSPRPGPRRTCCWSGRRGTAAPGPSSRPRASRPSPDVTGLAVAGEAVGAQGLTPLARAFPCSDARKCVLTSSWQLPHASGLARRGEAEPGVLDRRDLVGAMAIRAGDLRPSPGSAAAARDLRMERMRRAGPVVAGSAIDLLQARLVRKVRRRREVRVAVHAGDAGLAVDRGVELLRGTRTDLPLERFASLSEWQVRQSSLPAA